MKTPVISAGDPAGISYELIFSLFEHFSRSQNRAPIICGSLPIFSRLKSLITSRFEILPIRLDTDNPQIFRFSDYVIPVVDITPSSNWTSDLEITPGKPSALGGELSYLSLVKSLEIIYSGFSDGLLTAPISKESLRMSGYNYSGHTELLAEFDQKTNDEISMVFVSPKMTVGLVTRHLAVAQISDYLTSERIITTVKQTARLYETVNPEADSIKIKVLGLNPHCSENGMFGTEEQQIIIPAIAQLKKILSEKFRLEGPLPSDSCFNSEHTNTVYIAMYHDQGLIPFKMTSGHRGVNTTTGLSFIRTSPDFGCCWNLAWKFEANPLGFISAWELLVNFINSNFNR